MQRQRAEGRQTALIIVGRRPRATSASGTTRIDRSFAGFSDTPTYEDAREVGRAVGRRLRRRASYDLVELVYTRFLSAGSQEVVVRRFMPLDRSMIEAARQGDGPRADYEFEPSPEEILDRLLPRYAEARLYAALLNARGVGARRPPAGHEGGHRQRRRPDHHAAAGP